MASMDPDTWMWERARALLEEADRVQRTFFQPGAPGTRRPGWRPPADVFETASEVWVVIALPGVELDRLRVEVLHNEILVQGERALPSAFRKALIHRLEIPHGRFERRVELPPGSYELDQNELRAGCLFLSLRKLDRS
jgi:HSP20 family molecular chaperone IbpA